jgi:hypothetical protein
MTIAENLGHLVNLLRRQPDSPRIVYVVEVAKAIAQNLRLIKYQIDSHCYLRN